MRCFLHMQCSYHPHFPPEDAAGFYSKLRNEAALAPTSDERKALVPTIDASEAQATVESDRVRIFTEITDSIGMEQFNSQLQEYLERSLRAVATEALLERGGVESVGTAGSKVTLGMVQRELDEVKKVLVHAQEATKQEVKAELMVLAMAQDETKQEMKETKQEMKETKQEMKETKQEMKETKQEMMVMGGRILSLEAKIDTVLSLFGGAAPPRC